MNVELVVPLQPIDLPTHIFPVIIVEFDPFSILISQPKLSEKIALFIVTPVDTSKAAFSAMLSEKENGELIKKIEEFLGESD